MFFEFFKCFWGLVILQFDVLATVFVGVLFILLEMGGGVVKFGVSCFLGEGEVVLVGVRFVGRGGGCLFGCCVLGGEGCQSLLFLLGGSFGWNLLCGLLMRTFRWGLSSVVLRFLEGPLLKPYVKAPHEEAKPFQPQALKPFSRRMRSEGFSFNLGV